MPGWPTSATVVLVVGTKRGLGWIVVGSMLAAACGDDASTTETGVGPGDSGMVTTDAETSASETSTTDTSVSSGGSSDPGSTSADTTDATTGDSTEGDSTGAGGELPDPAVYRTPDVADVCGPTPEAPCTPGDMAWLAAEYGSEVQRADDAWVAAHGAVYRLVAFVERVGPSNIDAFVIDEAGAPLPGIPVAFYYDSLESPSRPDEWYPVKIETVTDPQGRVGFALGGGAYLDACGAGGPHAIWVSEPGVAPDTTVASDLADRLGMLGGTEHRHLDLLFQRVGPGQALAAAYCPLGG